MNRYPVLSYTASISAANNSLGSSTVAKHFSSWVSSNPKDGRLKFGPSRNSVFVSCLYVGLGEVDEGVGVDVGVVLEYRIRSLRRSRVNI